MKANQTMPTLGGMHDDLRPGIDAVEELDGATPPFFRRVFIAGEGDSEARGDATGLAAALAGRAEAVTLARRADLIVTGSARAGATGRVTLDPSDRPLLEGAECPVAVAPRGLAGRDDYRLRRIDVGVDGGRDSSVALDLAVRLAFRHDARLRLIAVAELDGAAREADPRELERLARRLEQATDGLAGIWVETELREGLPDQVILGLATGTDLLVLGSRAAYGNVGKVAIGDVAARVLATAPCPILIVPAA
jgi:nucleotide-binding universal stress UspA family protein